MMMQLLFTSVRNRLPAIHTFNIFFFILFFLSKCCIREKNQSNNKKVHILSPPVILSLHGDLLVLDYSYMFKVYIDISYSSKQNLFTYRLHIEKNL